MESIIFEATLKALSKSSVKSDLTSRIATSKIIIHVSKLVSELNKTISSYSTAEGDRYYCKSGFLGDRPIINLLKVC
jgi:hypothetical protein